MREAQNADAAELAKFAALEGSWWDTEGEFKPLHDINPLRLDYIDDRAMLEGKRVLDVGCGGGILSESMARRGAEVTGIDAGPEAIACAAQHCAESTLSIDYRCVTAEELAAETAHRYDVITCMELLEHVPDPASLVAACATLARLGGLVFFSTINRNPKSYLLAVVAAEYLLGLIPKGTHDYANFIRPSELERWGRSAGLVLSDIAGMTYNPFSKAYALSDDVGVNYLVCMHTWDEASD